MKKVLIYVLIFAVILIFAGRASQDTSSEDNENEVDPYASIQISNDNFALEYLKTKYTQDLDEQPVALVYFKFTNNTDNPLSMIDV